MPDDPHVALIIETSKVYGRELLLGIGRYIQHHGPWSTFSMERGQNDPDPPWLAKWKGQGIITRSLDHTLCERAARRGIPVVSLRHLHEKPTFPTIFPDQQIIGQRIASHFLERGFTGFGYCGVDDDKRWEQLRRKAFTATIKEHGFHIDFYKPTYHGDSNKNWEREQHLIGEWLLGLKKPVGIMASHDSQGVQLLDACRRVGVKVPDEVAVVSVDNDPVLCELASPPLSSLDQNVRRIGFEAAAMLNRMMHGEKVATENYFFAPGEVVTRLSSDVIAVDDRNLSAAMQYIRMNALGTIDVAAIATAAGMCRRSLEKKFTKTFGISPMGQVHGIRLSNVKRLLIETDHPLEHVARLSGFEYHEYMSRFFKKRTGITPGQFRREHR
ncbi:MAG: DNA-binding transcriptional regulator [Verrucomicrobia bacterium]|nr:DNA-binding transcriptional regulator [Verrucomicrobiota bacterium]